jgi:hypothetical protein
MPPKRGTIGTGGINKILTEFSKYAEAVLKSGS